MIYSSGKVEDVYYSPALRLRRRGQSRLMKWRLSAELHTSFPFCTLGMFPVGNFCGSPQQESGVTYDSVLLRKHVSLC